MKKKQHADKEKPALIAHHHRRLGAAHIRLHQLGAGHMYTYMHAHTHTGVLAVLDTHRGRESKTNTVREWV